MPKIGDQKGDGQGQLGKFTDQFEEQQVSPGGTQNSPVPPEPQTDAGDGAPRRAGCPNSTPRHGLAEGPATGPGPSTRLAATRQPVVTTTGGKWMWRFAAAYRTSGLSQRARHSSQGCGRQAGCGSATAGPPQKSAQSKPGDGPAARFSPIQSQPTNAPQRRGRVENGQHARRHGARGLTEPHEGQRRMTAGPIPAGWAQVFELLPLRTSQRKSECKWQQRPARPASTKSGDGYGPTVGPPGAEQGAPNGRQQDHWT